MVDDDELYELNEADALPPPENPEQRSPHLYAEQPDTDRPTYGLTPANASPPPGDLKIIKHPPRYCLACGHDLTMNLTGFCKGCDKRFDPNNPKTFSEEPIEEPGNWWAATPRLALYAALPMWLVGQLIIRGVGTAIANGDSRFTDVLFAFGALAVIPWVVLCVYFLLEAIDELHNPKPLVSVLLGLLLGIIITLGLHPALIAIGFIAGGYAGFLRSWREI